MSFVTTPRNDENAARGVRQTSVCRRPDSGPRLETHDKLKFVGHFRRNRPCANARHEE
jgi:hypothetical protein